MYDNHTFAKIGDDTTDRAEAERRALECFAEDGCGVLFARNIQNFEVRTLHGRQLDDGKWGVTSDDLAAFFDKVEELASWEER